MKLQKFSKKEIQIANNAFEIAEDLVSNYYKISSSGWLNSKYDIQTLSGLAPKEIVFGAFAQIIKYKGHIGNIILESRTYDFYKICIQDHMIVRAIKNNSGIRLFHFLLYVTTHELVHIVRFIRFAQNFEASSKEVLAEEARVHAETHNILYIIKDVPMKAVFHFYKKWLANNKK